MPVWGVSEPNINLWVKDVPLFYTLSNGRIFPFTLRYSQRNLAHSTNIYGVGNGWECSWRAYISLPTASTNQIWSRGLWPGRRGYALQSHSGTNYHFGRGPFGEYVTGQSSAQGQLLSVRLADVRYLERLFDYSSLIGNTNYLFLRNFTDRQGRLMRLNLTNVTNGSAVYVRLVNVIDFDGRTNIVTYTNSSFPQLITSVTDPHGRTCHLEYDSLGHLTGVVDVAGIRSAFAYNDNGLLTNQVTPCGATRFQSTEAGTSSQVRRLLAVLPDGSSNLFTYLTEALFVTNETLTIPTNTPVSMSPDYESSPTPLYDSFFWNARQMEHVAGTWTNLNATDYKLARMRHWKVASTGASSNVVRRLLMQREPSPDGTTAGHSRWFTYSANTNTVYPQLLIWPIQVAELLPDNTTRYTSIERNDWGQPTAIAGTYGEGDPLPVRTTTLSYDGSEIPRLERVSGPEPDGQGSPLPMRRYVYNSANQIAAVTNYVRSGGTWEEATSYTYTAQANTLGATNRILTSVQYPNGLVMTNQLDGTGLVTNRVWYTTASGGQNFATNRFTWAGGRVATSTDARGLLVNHYWDDLGRLTGRGYPDGSSVSNIYYKRDGAGYTGGTGGTNLLDRTGSKDRLGRWTYWDYDALRRVTTVTDARTNQTHFEWCSCGVLESVTDALTHTTSYYYDLASRLTNVVSPGSGTGIQIAWNEINQPNRLADALGSVDLYYNHQGLQTTVSNSFGVGQEQSYDINDRPTNVVLAAGAHYAQSYDNLGRLLTRTETHSNAVERFVYAANTAGAIAYTNQLATNAVLLTYDLFGRVQGQGFGYRNGANWVSVQSNRFTYTPAGDLQMLRDGLQHDTIWSYDAYGRTLSKMLGAINVWTNGYNTNGWVTKHWTAQKGLTQYGYDEVGNVTNVNYPADTDLTLRYDAANRLTNLVDSVGTHTFTWTDWGALASEDGPWAQDTVSYGYNDSHRRQSLSLLQPNAGAWSQSYGYDGNWRLSNVTSAAGAFAYYPLGASGLVKGLTLPNGSTVTNSFDPLGQWLATTLKHSSGSVLSAHSYLYDLAHQRTRQTLAESNFWDYGYDALGQLTSAKGKEAGGASRLQEQLTYGYDAAGNLTARTNNALIQTFTLNNSVNQLTSASRSGTLTVAGLVQGTPTSVTVKDNGNAAQAASRYADQSFARAGITPVDGANTFTAVAQDAGGRLATNTVTPWLPASASFTYDNDGNLTGDGRRTFEYDDADQLKAVQVAASWRTEFKYDGFGRRRVRVEKVWNGSAFVTAGETRYVYNHLVVLQERDAHNVPQVTYTRGADLSGRLQGVGGIGGLLARTDNAALLTSNATNAHAYYFADGGGNITALVDGRQNVVARYRYDPFGNLLGLAGPLAEVNLYRFSSKEQHAASGLYYYGFRFYDPSLQRWLNRDPIGERGGLNLHAFTHNDPINRVDQLGFTDCSRHSYLVVENATGLMGEWLEGDAERAGALLGMKEGFENKWAEKHEILETLKTAGSDDIVVFFGHSYQIDDGPACGIVANSDWPLYEVLGGDAMSASSLAKAINVTPGAPSLLIFASCLSADFSGGILNSTGVDAVIGLDSTVGLGDDRELLRALLGNMRPDLSVSDAVNRANAKVPNSKAHWILKTKPGCENAPIGSLLRN